MYRLEFKLEVLPKTTNANARRHWWHQKKHADLVRSLVLAAVGPKKPLEPLQRAIVTLTRHSSRPPDFDGLASSFKHVLDGLVRAGVLEDDSVQHIGQPNYKWEHAQPKRGFITVEVCERGESTDGCEPKDG